MIPSWLLTPLLLFFLATNVFFMVRPAAGGPPMWLKGIAVGCIVAALIVTLFPPRAHADEWVAFAGFGASYARLPTGEARANAEKLIKRCGLLKVPFPTVEQQEHRCPRAPQVRFAQTSIIEAMCGDEAAGCFTRRGYGRMYEDFIYLDGRYRNDIDALRVLLIHEIGHHFGWMHP